MHNYHNTWNFSIPYFNSPLVNNLLTIHVFVYMICLAIHTSRSNIRISCFRVCFQGFEILKSVSYIFIHIRLVVLFFRCDFHLKNVAVSKKRKRVTLNNTLFLQLKIRYMDGKAILSSAKSLFGYSCNISSFGNSEDTRLLCCNTMPEDNLVSCTHTHTYTHQIYRHIKL